MEEDTPPHGHLFEQPVRVGLGIYKSMSIVQQCYYRFFFGHPTIYKFRFVCLPAGPGPPAHFVVVEEAAMVLDCG